MPRPPARRRVFPLAVLAGGAVAALVAASGVLVPIRARPPTTPSPLPAEAFRPVPTPTATKRPAVTPPPAARRLDGGEPEPTPTP